MTVYSDFYNGVWTSIMYVDVLPPPLPLPQLLIIVMAGIHRLAEKVQLPMIKICMWNKDMLVIRTNYSSMTDEKV